MKTVELRAKLDIKGEDFERLKILEHHVEHLFDLDNWSEIKTVHDVKIIEENDTPEKEYC